MRKIPVANIKGEKGDKGDKGDLGPVGNEGPRGPEGLRGIQGDKGDTGIGEKGDRGDVGPRGFTGDKGDKGDTGNTGLKGDKGDKGDTGDVGPAGPNTVPTLEFLEAEGVPIGLSSVGSSEFYEDTEDPAVGGFLDEDGKETDLMVGEDGRVLDRIIDRWGQRIKPAMGVPETDNSSWYGGGFSDEDGRHTELIVENDGTVPNEILDRWASRMTLPEPEVPQFDLDSVYSGPDILTIGDSLTASGNIASRLATLTGRTVRNMGVGGEGNLSILGRLGAWPFMVSPAGMVIPASGSVDVTLVSSWDNAAVAPNIQGTGVRGEADSYLWGTILGVRVRISLRVNDEGPPVVRIWQITRDVPGTEVTLVRPEPFIPEHGSARQGDIIIAWIGQNGPSDTSTIVGCRAIEHWMSKAGKRFLFMTKPTGSNTGWTDFEKQMRDEFGRRYCNVRRFLIDDAMPLMGLTPTVTALGDDAAHIAAGSVPGSLRTDGVHHTAAAQQAIAEWLLYPRLTELEML